MIDIIYQSWCGYCSRGWQDKRWLEVKGDTIICSECGKKSQMITDPKDDAYFYLKRLDNVGD